MSSASAAVRSTLPTWVPLFLAPPAEPLIQGFNAIVTLGGAGNDGEYGGITGPFTFGSGGFFPASSGSGDIAGVIVDRLRLPSGYASGAPLASTATWNNQTFASLGVTPGTYVWTWGSGEHADSFTLQIGPTNGVPETGSTIALMLGAVGTLIAFRQKLVGQAR